MSAERFREDERLFEALRLAVGAEHVLTDPEETRVYDSDALSFQRELPRAVVLPASEAEVIAVLAACRLVGAPVVPRGAGTGLSGGVRPLAEGIVLCLSRMSQIIKIDPEGPLAVLQPGVRNLAISEAAAAFGLCYAPDPSSQIACTIGGNVSENAGGVHCLKYGLTLHNVLAIRGVLSTGEVITLGGLAPESPGLDLLPVVIGSEGMMLVVTEVTVKLIPKPEAARLVMASFDSVERCASAVADILAAGIVPAGLEMMDQGAVAVAEDFVQAGYDLSAAALLLVECDGTPEEVTEDLSRVLRVLERAGASRCQAAADEAERLRFWSGRKNAFPAAGRAAADYYCMDGTVPRRALAGLLTEIGELSKTYALRCINVFHAGDGNMHPLILFDARKPGELDRAEAFGQAILEACLARGGTVTGEHGVGVEKLDSLCIQFGEGERALFHGLKAAFDPERLLNPDKGIPSLHRCIEFGRRRGSPGLSLGLEHF